MTEASGGQSLRGQDRAVLVVEDEFLIATMIEDVLVRLGFRVVGPASSVGSALEAFSTATPDAALLDLNVRGEPIEPVAAALDERGIPFAFISGYSADALPSRWRTKPLV